MKKCFSVKQNKIGFVPATAKPIEDSQTPRMRDMPGGVTMQQQKTDKTLEVGESGEGQPAGVHSNKKKQRNGVRGHPCIDQPKQGSSIGLDLEGRTAQCLSRRYCPAR